MRTDSNRKVAVALAVVAFLGLSAALAGALVSSILGKSDDRIAPGVEVAGIAVGGLTQDGARQRLRVWARAAQAKPVTLVAPRSGRRWNIALFDAGGRFGTDAAVQEAYRVGRGGSALERLVARLRGSRYPVQIEPAFHLDRSKLHKRLARIGRQVHVPARNARATLSGDYLVVTRTERKGVRLDVEATAAALLRRGENALREGGAATLVIAEEKPSLTAADLQTVDHRLASFTTHYGSSSRGRRHNVELAASHINGTLLAPGETFSYNDTVGPRSRRLGWREAPTYLYGQVVPGTGGGICQVSSTLYNAVLLSGLKVVRRSHHSMPVKYVRPGLDATVVYGVIDLRFRNTSDGPVYIAAHARGGRLTLALYGRRPTEPREIRVVAGKPRPRRAGGFVVTTRREMVAPDGSVVREVVSTDTYRPLVKTAARRPRPLRTLARSPRRSRIRPVPAVAVAPPPPATPI